MADHDEEAHVCPICLEDSRHNDPITLPCQHVFCRRCVDSQILTITHDGDNMSRCSICQRTLFGNADRLFEQGNDELLQSEVRIAAYEECVVAARGYSTGPNGENRLASAAHHNIGEIYLTFPDLENLERARQNYVLSFEYNPGNHTSLTMIGQCVYGLRHDDDDQEAIARARDWWSQALVMNPYDLIAIEQMAITNAMVV